MPLRDRVLEDMAAVFGALAHPTRVRILALLHQGERDVTELSRAANVSPTNASQHLALLRAHHLVTVRRNGARMCYSIRDPRIAEVIDRTLDILAEDVSHAREVQRAIERVRHGQL